MRGARWARGGAQSPKSSGLCAAFSKIYNESHNKGRDRVDFPARTIPLENISPRAHKSNLTNGRNLKTLKIWDQTQLQQPTLWCRCPGFVRATAPYNCFSFSLFFSQKKNFALVKLYVQPLINEMLFKANLQGRLMSALGTFHNSRLVLESWHEHIASR